MSLVFLSEFEKQVTTYHNAGQFGENEKNQEIIEKIKNEYDLVGYLHYVLREWKIFGKPEYTDRILGLYARKPDT